MKTLTWLEFKRKIEDGLARERRFRAVDKNGRSFPLYRGHSSSEWSLESTLERRLKNGISLRNYMNYCISARRYLGNFSPSPIPFEESASTYYSDLQPNFPNFEYLAFLRHHGFPSPFLDWTESPYVAAFFAFRNEPSPVTESVRVIQYRSYRGIGRSYATAQPHIIVLGPFATVHERHAIQQCWYTVAAKEENKQCILSSHLDALDYVRDTGGMQDEVEFYDIRISDREEALTDLYRMNITAYTLFRTLDTLIETTIPRIF